MARRPEPEPASGTGAPSACVHVAHTIDVHPALDWLAAVNAARSSREQILPAALLLRAAALALRDVPQLNARWHAGHAVPGAGIHLGVRLGRAQSAAIRVIDDADHRSLDALTALLREPDTGSSPDATAEAARPRATVTIASLGEDGAETIFGALVPPQVASIAFGAILERPVSLGGEIVTGALCTVSATVDGRADDGRHAARLLATLGRLLQSPDAL